MKRLLKVFVKVSKITWVDTNLHGLLYERNFLSSGRYLLCQLHILTRSYIFVSKINLQQIKSRCLLTIFC